MDHPPIPQNCPHFAVHDYGDGAGPVEIFWCSEPFWSHDHGEPWQLKPDNFLGLQSMQRNVIAAVARCAWLDEAQKLYKKCQDENRVHLRYGIEDEPEHDAYENCLNNAGLWEEWGRK